MPLDNLDKQYQHAYIFDDICLEEKKLQESTIGSKWIRCRKYNASVFYLSQSFFKIPKIIRDNSDFIVLKRIADSRELNVIHRICAPELKFDEFKNKYMEAVGSLDGHGSFIIDIAIRQPSLKYRANYTSVFI